MGETMDAVMTAAVPNVTSHPYTLHLHTDTHFFPGLANYDAIGFHVNVLAVLAAAGIFFPVAGLLLVSQLWERVGKELVFGKDPEDDPDADDVIVLCGVDCSAYPIFRHPKIVRAALFAERWHHGQYRRSGEPYVTHAWKPRGSSPRCSPNERERGERSTSTLVAACMLHDVVDDTECELEDVEERVRGASRSWSQDVSTLGKLPQILRRYQRRSEEGQSNLRAGGGEGGRDRGRALGAVTHRADGHGGAGAKGGGGGRHRGFASPRRSTRARCESTRRRRRTSEKANWRSEREAPQAPSPSRMEGFPDQDCRQAAQHADDVRGQRRSAPFVAKRDAPERGRRRGAARDVRREEEMEDLSFAEVNPETQGGDHRRG